MKKLCASMFLFFLSGAALSDTTLTGSVGTLQNIGDELIEAGYEGLGDVGSRVAMGFQADAGDIIEIVVQPINPAHWAISGDIYQEESVALADCQMFNFWDPADVIWAGNNREIAVVEIPSASLWAFDCQWTAGPPESVVMSAVLRDM